MTRLRRNAMSLVPAIALGAGLMAGAAAQSTPSTGAGDPCIAIAAGTPFPGMMGPGGGPGRGGHMMGTPGAGMGGMMDGTPGPGMGMMRAVDRQTADLVFIDMMIPHHRSAIAMARIAETRAEHPRLRELAGQIAADQEAEIAEMEALRGTLPGGGSQGMGPDDRRDSMNWMMGRSGRMGRMMGGGIGMAGMASLCEAEPFDPAFIGQMIPHHQGAVMMAEAVISTGKSDELRRLAERMVTSQRAEIAGMEAIRAELGGGTPQP